MFTSQQTDVLRAVMNRIIPPDDFPDACDAGVIDYLYGQFQRDLKHLPDTYRAGLDSIEAEARATGATGFTTMCPEEQDALLSRIESGRVETGWSTNLADFFLMLVHHAAEGYYSDSGNGGNREGVSWKMIGFEVSG